MALGVGGESPSLGADVGGESPSLAQMWAGRAPVSVQVRKRRSDHFGPKKSRSVKHEWRVYSEPTSALSSASTSI